MLTTIQGGLRKYWPDLLVGLSVAGIILPEAVAYAGIANLPPIMGIVAACVGLLIYGLVGTSRFALVAATSSSAAVLAAAIRSLAVNNSTHALTLSAGLVLLTGVFFVICALFRLDRIAHFIARPVVRGLALGLAIIIVLRQFAKIVGLHATHSDALPLAYELINKAHEWNLYGLGLAASALLLLNVFKHWPRIPGPLLVAVIGIVLNLVIDLPSHGIALVGAIALPTALPSALASWHPSIPALSSDEWLRLAELAPALMLILFAESYSSIRTTALQHGDAVNVNRDLWALGCANIVSGLFHAMPVGAGYSATIANQAIGARSRVAGMAAGVYILLMVWLLIKYVALLPECVLAAIVIYAMQHALSFAPLQPYLKWRRDRLIVLVAITAVLIFGVLDGLLAAIAFSLILLIRGLSQPRISVLGRLGNSHDYVALDTHIDAHAVPGMLIVRLDEPLFFANAEDMLENAFKVLQQSRNVNTLILSLEESPNIDGTAIEALDQFATRVRNSGCTLMLARLKEHVLSVLERAQVAGLQGVALHPASVAAVVKDAVASNHHLQR